MRRLLLGLAAFSLILSGCVGTSPTPDSTSATVNTQATVDDATGAVEGLVTDDELVPIKQALVGIAGAGQVRTDEAGKFAISNLPPGAHVVLVSALGYFEKQTKASVQAGEVTRVDIVLMRIPVSEPGFDEVMKVRDTLPVSDACAEREGGNYLEQSRGITWQKYTFPVNATKADGTDLLGIRMKVELKHTQSDITIDIDMRLYDPQGKLLGTGGSEGADETVDYKKVVKPGNYVLFVCYWAGAQAEYRITTTISYEQGDRAQYLRENPSKIEYPDD